MNWDQVEGKWKQYKGQAREKWGALTDNDLHLVAGKRDELIGVIQERYGYAKEQASKEVDSFVKTLKHSPTEDVLGDRSVYIPDSRRPQGVEEDRPPTNELRERYKTAIPGR